jgi:hypothetical protein
LACPEQELLVSIVEEVGLEDEHLEGMEDRKDEDGEPAFCTLFHIGNHVHVGYRVDHDDGQCADKQSLEKQLVVLAVFGKDEVIYHANGDADDEGDSLECEGMHGSS